MIKPQALILLLTLTCTPALAANVYTFADCLELVKKNNAELIAAEQSLESARYNLNASYSNYLPQISANLGYQKGETDQVESEGYSATLNATQNVFNGFSDMAKVSENEGKLKVAEASLRTVKAKISYDLKSAFANVIYAQESLKLTRSIQKRRADNLNMVELRFQSGRENKGSVLLSKAYLKQAQLDVLKAENFFNTSRSSLIRVTGLSPDAEFEVQGKAPESNPSSVTPSFTKLAEQTPEHQQAQGQIQSAEAGLSNSRSEFLPSLDLSGSVGNTGESWYPERDRWSVGATLSWSLFSGGKDYFTNKSAFAQKLVAENTWKNSELEIIVKLRQAFAEFTEAVEQVKVSDAFVEAGSVRAEIGRSKYNNGLTTFDDWDKIENDLISYQKDQTLKRRDRVVAEANWEKTQGVGVLP
ncbi:TolC family protein [Bdellovibrio bacteriovorus]|uniref:FusA/NodT family protein n=1 Tax=Bdellovibrio bacteriovorus TaxID=959 RepID=A0A1Z3NBA6_BDEBC|nr:TolC family protein [Bdellovibrio bacteriovorus]ASD64762.1 FusA/NodT family protein [Bdellovibrio bacteriovorus]